MTAQMVYDALVLQPDTSADLAKRLSAPEALVRQCLSVLVFDRNCVTCNKKGVYRPGDPTPLLVIG